MLREMVLSGRFSSGTYLPPVRELAKELEIPKSTVHIVIGVISILASLLLPSLGKAKERVKAIHCLNNQKQTGLAIQSYMSDFSFYFASSNASKWTTNLMLNSYLSNGDILCCPSSKVTRYADSASGWFTYGAIYTNDASSCIQMSAPQFAHASRVYMLGCSLSIENKKPMFRMFAQDDVSENYGRPHLIHQQKVNMYFLDGHAEGKNMTTLRDVVQVPNWVKYAADQSGSVYLKIY